MSKKPTTQLDKSKRSSVAIKRLVTAGLLCAGLSNSQAQSTWNGSADTDWNNAANWSAGVPTGVNATINSNAPNICTVSATPSAVPVDIIIGQGAGRIGQLNQTGGDLSTGAGNWFILGLDSGTGIYNMTGGTLNAQDVHMARGATTALATMNVSNATVNTAGAVVVSDSYNNTTASQGTLNVYNGGTINSENDIVIAFAGGASSFGELNVSTGAVVNVATATKRWFIMSVWDFLQGRVNINGGTLNLNANTDIRFSTGSWGPGANVGASVFNLNGGSVLSWSGNLSGDGLGILDLNNNGGLVNNTFNLNGGTLAISQVTANLTTGTATFNFNGGTLRATTSAFEFIKLSGPSQTANIKDGGAVIDTAGYDVTIPQALLANGTGGLTKIGLGTLTLSGNSTYTGATVISNGSLALSGTATLASQIVIPSGRTLDVTALTVGIQNPVSGTGDINGTATAAAGMAVYPGTDGTVGTLTFNSDLNMDAGGSLRFDVSTSHSSGNDQVAVTGTLTVSSATVIRIKALSGAANLSTGGDYVLCTAGALTVNSTPALAWDGTTPANYLNYSVAQVGNTLVLKYTSSTAPTVTASANPTTVVRNQSVAISATVTPGTGSVTNVGVDASQIGGSATASLVLSSTPNVYTNTFAVAANATPGAKTLTVVAKANSGLNSPGYAVNITVVATNETWTGAGANNNWSTSQNWNTSAPGLSGDSVTFAGSTRTSPDMDANYSVTGVAFASGASSFTVGSVGGNTLTLASGSGVVNNSANPQTLNVPVTMGAAQTFNAAAGNLNLANNLDKAGNLVTVTGAATTVISGNVLNGGSLFKRGSGALTVSSSATWDQNQAASGGFTGPLIAQAGTVKFDSSSVQTVTGELVIGGVIANGGAGNNAAIVVDGATLNVSSWLSIGRGNGVGAVSSDLVLSNGASVTAQDASAGYNGGNGANMPRGSVTLNDTSTLTINNQFHIAEAAGANFSVNVNGTSTLNVGGFMDLCIGFGGTVGNMNVNGGTVNVGGDPYIGHWGNGTATLNLNSGSFNVGTAVERWMFMGYWDNVNGVINVNGGSLQLWNNSRIKMARNVNHGGNPFSHVINHNTGNVTYYSDAGATTGGTGDLDLQYDGGVAGVSTYNLNGGTLTVPTIISTTTNGTRTFNFNGGTLKAATDAVTLLNLGTGNAHAYVRTGGAIIDTDGKNVTIASALEHSPASLTDGGLVKKGLGALNLTGANNYLGTTIVAEGTLQLAQATLAPSSTVVVSNAAVLQLDFAGVNQVNALVLNGINQPAGTYNSTTGAPFITGTGSLLVQPIATNPTNITMSVAGSTLSLSWPADHLGWILQQQINGLSVGISTNWVDVAGSGSITSTNITLSPANPTVFYRLRKP
jgi:autotransporter-associated beta strand protein